MVRLVKVIPWVERCRYTGAPMNEKNEKNAKESGMNRYYRERTPVYDDVYAYPERQQDLRLLEQYVEDAFAGHHVLEVAAGTGYWTQFIARRADSMLVTDAEAEPLKKLSERELRCPVVVEQQDVYRLSTDREFDGGFAGLWLSHVPVERIPAFFDSFHACLAPGASVILMDNSEAQLQRLPITERDEAGNTYQSRELESGSTHLVLKNFPSEDDLRRYVEDHGEVEEYLDLENFWLLQYRSN